MIIALAKCGGGLLLFLWGLQNIKTSFAEVVNQKTKEILELLTVNFFLAIIMGIIITMLIQSSSAAIIIIISLVNLEVLNFKQALGVIIGANIGTTITVQLISFNLNNYLVVFLFCGLFFYTVYYFTKIKNYQYLGQGFTSFCCLLGGLNILGSSLLVIKSSVIFIKIIGLIIQWPLLALFLGVCLTSVVQSSSAVTALVVALAKQNLMTLETAIFLALGSNIGTCVTAFLAGIGCSKEAKLAAWAHLYFNVCGVIILLPILPYFITFIQHFTSDLSRQIANAHTLFNLLTAVVITLGRKQFVALVYKLNQNY